MGAILSTSCLLWKQNKTLTTAAVAPTAHPSLASFWLVNGRLQVQMPSVGTFSVSLSSSITASVKSFESFGFGLLLQFHFPHPVLELYKQTIMHVLPSIPQSYFLLLVLSNEKRGQCSTRAVLFGITHSDKHTGILNKLHIPKD